MAISNVNMQRQMVDPAQSYANSYANNIMNSDEDFAGLGQIGGAAYMNNNSNIFGIGMGYGGEMNYGGGMGMGYGGGMNYGGGMGMGYGPGSETMNMTQEQFLQHQEKMENYQIEKQVRQQKKLANAEFSSTAAEDSITRQIGILQRKIKNNEQDNVYTEYNKLINEVEIKLKEGGYIGEHTDKNQIKAYAEKLYLKSTGKSVTEDLTQNGDSGFVQGLKQGIGCGFGSLFTNKKNYEDNISAITGEAKSSTSSTWKAVGNFVAGGLSAALLVFGGLKGARAIRGTHP